MSSTRIDTRILARPALVAGGASVDVARMGYWHGNDFRAGVPATQS